MYFKYLLLVLESIFSSARVLEVFLVEDISDSYKERGTRPQNAETGNSLQGRRDHRHVLIEHVCSARGAQDHGLKARGAEAGLGSEQQRRLILEEN